MESRELTEWMVFDRFYPIGREREDWRSAQISAVLAEIHRDKTARPESYGIEEFMPMWGNRESEDSKAVNVEDMSPEGRVFWLETMNTAFGGIDKRHG